MGFTSELPCLELGCSWIRNEAWYMHMKTSHKCSATWGWGGGRTWRLRPHVSFPSLISIWHLFLSLGLWEEHTYFIPASFEDDTLVLNMECLTKSQAAKGAQRYQWSMFLPDHQNTSSSHFLFSNGGERMAGSKGKANCCSFLLFL